MQAAGEKAPDAFFVRNLSTHKPEKTAAKHSGYFRFWEIQHIKYEKLYKKKLKKKKGKII